MSAPDFNGGWPDTRSLTISIGSAHPAAISYVAQWHWYQFAQYLTKEPLETNEKSDLGWYIPATFDPVYRDSANFVSRDAITFDFDKVNIDTWGDVCNAWADTSFALYTTFSHLPEAPRFRVVMPLSRPAGYDEFQAVARKVAADVGVELIARESFVPAQMMYAPTRRLGGLFTAHVNEGAWLDVDAVLGEYKDWTDARQWPARKDADHATSGASERIDPRAKPGLIGEFNSAYLCDEAIQEFGLPYARVR